MPSKALADCSQVRIQTGPPAVFGVTAMLAMHGCGLLLVLPVLACVVAMSLMPIGYLPLLLPFIGVAISAIFLPVGFGNPYVKRIVRRHVGADYPAPDEFVVQATLTPRLRGGVRGLFEDADDLGRLTFGPSALVFEGDSLNLCLPFHSIENVTLRNVGMRGMFVYGQRLVIDFRGSPDFTAIEFAERTSSVLWGSRRITRSMRSLLEQNLARQGNAHETASIPPEP